MNCHFHVSVVFVVVMMKLMMEMGELRARMSISCEPCRVKVERHREAEDSIFQLFLWMMKSFRGWIIDYFDHHDSHSNYYFDKNCCCCCCDR